MPNCNKMSKVHGAWCIQGDPTEAALLVAERKLAKLYQPDPATTPNPNPNPSTAQPSATPPPDAAPCYERLGEIPFTSQRMMMSVLVTDHADGGAPVLFAKGAPDVLLAHCTHIRQSADTVALDAALLAQVLADVAAIADDVMARKPRLRSQRIINTSMWLSVIESGVVMATLTLLTLDAFLPGGLIEPITAWLGPGPYSIELARTAAFTVLVLTQLFNCLNTRSATISAFKTPFANRWLWAAIALSGISPQGCQVFSFAHPSAQELKHDFLWRTTRDLPERGRIGIFNRSYYEEVLIVRVHSSILHSEGLPDVADDESVWHSRYRSIVDLERHLHLNGTRIVKVFLHLSKEEQRKRLLARIDQSNKNWKFSAADITERQFWDSYMQAYNHALSATSTKDAPWFIVPADDKDNARLIVSQIVLNALEDLKLSYPAISAARQRELQVIRGQLEGELNHDTEIKSGHIQKK